VLKWSPERSGACISDLPLPLAKIRKRTRNATERATRNPPNPPGLVEAASRRAFRAKLAGSCCQTLSFAPSRFTARNRPHCSPKSFASPRSRRRPNTVYHLRDFEVQRRHAALVAILLDTRATLIDEILDLHDRIVGSAFAKAKRAYEASFQESGKAINEKVRLYAQVGQALIKAKEAGIDPFAAIEQIISWECFTQSVSEAEKLARSEDFDYLWLLGNHYSQFRRYTPTFLKAFEFKAAPVAQRYSDLEPMRFKRKK
jgi:hypothetical protein